MSWSVNSDPGPWGCLLASLSETYLGPLAHQVHEVTMFRELPRPICGVEGVQQDQHSNLIASVEEPQRQLIGNQPANGKPRQVVRPFGCTLRISDS